MRRRAGWLAGILATATGVGAATAPPQDAETVARFESKVRPVLVAKCIACHGASQASGGVRLDTPAGAKAAAARIPGVLTHVGAVRMPPSGKLPESDVVALSDWARAGAPLPRPVATGRVRPPLWSVQPVRRPAPPKVRAVGRVRNPIDRFVLARLEAKGLTLGPEADRRTLIRRASFDLTGLPPTESEIDAFLADRKPGAWERVVDRLLASPRYGETWGRHWLDLVRYCNSLDARGTGSEGDLTYAWRYRDWVVDAFNADMPYGEFLLDQVAGDLVPAPDGDLNVRGTIATGFLAIGNWGNGDADKDKILTDIADDQVDTVGKAFLGLTIGCARCHDHKFDPIATADYYSLAGVFFSTHILPKLTPKGAGEIILRVPLETKADVKLRAALAKEEADLQAWRTQLRARIAESMAPRTRAYLTAVRTGDSTGLEAWAVRRWREALGLVGHPLMTKPVRALGGNTGVDGVAGKGDNPSQVVNTNTEERRIATFTLPPRSVAMHPSPGNGVVAGWTSPVNGGATVRAMVVDADPACGNGVAWRIEHHGARGVRTLAEGTVGNAGKQEGIAVPETVAVTPGDRIELLILPAGEYSCDTTVVDLEVRLGDRRWNLSEDAVRNPGVNPVPDAYGNAATWRFSDPAGTPGATLPAAVRDAWAKGDDQAAAAAFLSAPADPEGPFHPAAAADLSEADRLEWEARARRVAALRTRVPATVAYANAAQEGGVPESPHAGVHDVAVHRRGRYDQLGEMVPRGVPSLLTGGAPIVAKQGSGRLELGTWLADPRNPLVPRVLANRLWQRHFGEGIVRTTSNFGALGERPTHPELLDWLASEFARAGGSIKKLHRLMLTSATWMQSSLETQPLARRVDPENRLLHRMHRQRLSAEALRDSLLSASGTLDTTAGGPAFREFETPRRSVYCMSIRSDRTGFLPLFDMADSTNGVERRTESLVAPQALYLMHADFVQDQAARLGERLRGLSGTDPERIDRAYRWLYGRPATLAERAFGAEFLRDARAVPAPNPQVRAWSRYAHVLLCANEFLYVD